MVKRKRKNIGILFFIIAAIILCGCQRQTMSESGEQGGKTLVFGDTTFNSENGISDINPHNSGGGWGCIRYGVGETLFRFTDTMEIVPWLAESLENIDENTWKLVIKDEIRFSSGRKLNAAAVKKCLEALVDHHSRAAGDLHIQKMAAEGQVLTITTGEPVPALPNYLADPYSCIIDMEEGTEKGIVCGTGPYKAIALETDKSLTLIKNEDYWDGTPQIDTILVQNISDGDTLTAALQTGEIDAAYGLPYLNYPLFQNDDYGFSGCETSRVFFAAMNYKSSVTGDPAVRKAIAMGIDKEGFVKALLNGNGNVAAGVYPESFSFGGNAVTAETYNLEKAKKILEKAGWRDTNDDGIREKNGQPLVIRWLTYPSRQELPLLAEAAQATLGEIGIKVEINNTPNHNTIKKDLSAWDVYASAMVTAPTGDPSYFFSYHCLESSSQNDGMYYNNKLEKLAKKMSRTFDVEKRNNLAIKMQQIILDDNGYVFVAHLRMNMVFRKNVRGLHAHPCDYYEITVDTDIND